MTSVHNHPNNPIRRIAEPLSPLTHFDLEVRFEPASPTCRSAAVLLLGPSAKVPRIVGASDEQRQQQPGALIGYDFRSCCLTGYLGPVNELLAAWERSDGLPQQQEQGGGCEGCREGSSAVRIVGGRRLQGMRTGDALHLRVLLDWSVLEVFTGSGQALATRAYLLPAADAAEVEADGGVTIELWAMGEGGAVVTAAVHQMGSAFEDE